MKNFAKKSLALLLVILTLVSTFAIAISAATAWPSFNSSKPIKTYTISTGNNTTAYTSKDLSAKKGTIYASDEIYIQSIGKNSKGVFYGYGSYPVSNGRKYAFFPLSVVTKATEPSEYVTAKSGTTTYRRASTSSTAGSISKGDRVYKLAVSGSYTQVLYNIGSISNPTGWRMAWIKTTVYNGWKSTPTTSKSMSNALYGINDSKSYITCKFDGYVNTKGRHEGIDFKRSNGSAVYSLTSGEVVRVVEGARGSSGLSTIAIYDSSTNKTVIYLHTNPNNSLYVGQRISVGQQIAVEDWRGCSSSGGGHTHVEVRSGRKTSAAKSVNDYTLENSNPTSFWNAKGYSVK